MLYNWLITYDSKSVFCMFQLENKVNVGSRKEHGSSWGTPLFSGFVCALHPVVPGVQIPSTPSMLLTFVVKICTFYVIALRKGRK